MAVIELEKESGSWRFVLLRCFVRLGLLSAPDSSSDSESELDSEFEVGEVEADLRCGFLSAESLFLSSAIRW